MRCLLAPSCYRRWTGVARMAPVGFPEVGMIWLSNRGISPQWHDRAWARAKMAAWDERFAALSPAARRLFVEDIRAAARPDSVPPKTPAGKLPAAPLAELAEAGLVEVL